MSTQSAIATLSALSASSLGVFRGQHAVARGVTRNELATLCRAGILERLHPDTYRMTVVARSNEQRLHAALTWAGSGSAAAGRSAAELYKLEGVRAVRPEIVVPSKHRLRTGTVIVHRYADRSALRVRQLRQIPTASVEHTLVTLANDVPAEAFEIACEDARRRKLTSIPALDAYLRQFPHRPGAGPTRKLIRELDPVHPSRSTLEVMTRRLLVANGITDFVREFPLDWNGKTYYFDFAFTPSRTILETNSEHWHADPRDYEYDNEKWSVPARHGWRIVFATWDKVTPQPVRLLDEIRAALISDHSTMTVA